MIVNYDYPGQLCNRIWSLVPSIAKGIACKERVLILNFGEYSSFFQSLNKNKLVSFKSITLLSRILLSLRYRNYIHYSKKNILSSFFNINLTEGWHNLSNNQEDVIKYSDEIRDIFDISADVKNEVDSFLSSLHYDFIVGVHIRRGDYKEWLDGIYYYENSVFSTIINDISEQMRTADKKVGFLLCSNEDIDCKLFSEDSFVIPNSSGIKDLYALSKCSYIIGPPSTFSQWASFYGKVPLKFVLNADERIQLSDFSQIIAINRFENGNILSV